MNQNVTRFFRDCRKTTGPADCRLLLVLRMMVLCGKARNRHQALHIFNWIDNRVDDFDLLMEIWNQFCLSRFI